MKIARRCIYGLDINPMAVELCKVGLWMEAVSECGEVFLDDLERADHATDPGRAS